MTRGLIWTLCVASLGSCGGRDHEPDPYDLDFDIPRTEAFAEHLSDYGLYDDAATLTPAADVHVYELSSELYTDYAHKQRLMWVPEGEAVQVDGGEIVSYPEGTTLAKTFYYLDDERDASIGRHIVETRLLVKTEGLWNVATYVWDNDQREATLLLDGTTTVASWTDAQGRSRSTRYAVPHEGECVTCHQSGERARFIGPTLRNLNRRVVRDGREVEQLDYLVEQGVLAPFERSEAPSLPSYTDASLALDVQARAYLDANCAHCHNPEGWDEADRPDLDLRYETSLPRSGIARKADDMVRQLENGEMPYLGTTLVHDEGVALVVDYLESL